MESDRKHRERERESKWFTEKPISSMRVHLSLHTVLVKMMFTHKEARRSMSSYLRLAFRDVND